ncbi:MAG: DUF6029 family protein [Paludibacteraceae bacterium]
MLSSTRKLAVILFLGVPFVSMQAQKDTVYVTGGLQHESLFPTVNVDNDRTTPKADWAKIDHLSNTYLDLGVRYEHNGDNKAGFQGVEVMLRGELTQWPLLGYDADFGGYGLSHLHVALPFKWGRVTVGDVYGQFGSGFVLRLYEDRPLGIDNALRGGKVEFTPYKGIYATVIGGKQRRYWNCYTDGAGGWNYTQDATIGGNLELGIHEWSKVMQDAGANLTIGGSYVSKYQRMDTIITAVNDQLYMYNLPEWVGAGDVRAQLQMKGWNALIEYAYKANDPTIVNDFSYKHGEALLLSLSYSQKGMSVILQAKRSENMSFRSDRKVNNLSGMLNHMPPFANQHTYALASLYPYATEAMGNEWAFQGEVRYTWKRGTPMGGKYGTTLKINASHIRGLSDERTLSDNASWWGIGKETYYTDVNLELNKKINKQWYLGAMLMYQGYNKKIVEGHGDMIHAGIAVVEAKYAVNKNVQMRAEVQYLYTKQDLGQWFFALYEISLWKQLMISGQYQYNIGYGNEEPEDQHFYTVAATWQRKAHRLMAGYTKTRAGYNCSGGVCRYVPKQEGVNITYNFSW